MDSKEKLEWYKNEFEKISFDINDSDSLSYYEFLRIRNYKLQIISTANETDIRKYTGEAFKKAKKDEIVAAVVLLTKNLDGVGIPMASAILAMKYPERFAIIDRRVLQALKEEMWLKNYRKDPEIYKNYLLKVREEAKKSGMKLREYELYLFKKGKAGDISD